MKLRKCLLMGAVMVFLGGVFLLFFASPGQSQPGGKLPAIAGASYVGEEQCNQCHEQIAKSFKKTVHARLAKFEVIKGQKGCESCHGPGSLHIEGGGDKSKIISFKDLTPSQKTEACLRCHNAKPGMNWAGSEHALNEVSCTDCHSPHKSTRKAMLAAEPLKLCAQCHQDKLAKAYYPSRHPLKEGKITCTSCHNPHDSIKRIVTSAGANNLCFNCHAEKQGPFTYEHAPVKDNCSNCHNPHGTVADSLLKQNQIFLCAQCHNAHARWMPGTSSAPNTKESRQYYNTKCTYCHSRIHGTDLPSKSGYGRFTR